jgi:5-methylcytosine-specific restriction enzyme subunit McrC
MITLFEYGEWHDIQHRQELRSGLIDIWENRSWEVEVESLEDDVERTYQPFLQFDGNKIRARNFVGFIQHGEEVIEIYPKVFREHQSVGKNLMLRHLFHWFDYCRRWRFPFTTAVLDLQSIEKFPELIIHIFANSIFDAVSTHPYMHYCAIEESMTIPRGRINFDRYIRNGFSKGNAHKLDCDYEPFIYDNKVNQTIKYCTRLLLSQTRLPENQRLLQDTLFVLDEVEDLPIAVSNIETVSFNPFFEDYTSVMQTCKSILEHSIFSNSPYYMSQWTMLFPMEYIFEDFVAGFLERHFSDKWIVEYQKSDLYLSDRPRAFNLQHDILLTERNKSEKKRRLIIDTKYKLRNPEYKKDIKKGISQDDMYQVLSYANKRACTEVFLLYPNLSETQINPDSFEVASGFSEQIVVKAFEIPFWSIGHFDSLTKILRDTLTNELHL